jgi:CubicO group peptidase (beta-lactamase class C family)
VYAIFGQTAPDKVLAKNLGPDLLTGLRNTTLADLSEKVARSPLKFQPGTGFEYGLNLDILGYIIELASGLKLDDFFRKEIFEPLGMVDTDFFCPPEKFHRMAKCYEHAPGMSFKRSLQPTRNELWGEKPVNLAGGGGLVSTIGDYSKFTTCLLNQGAIPGTDKRILRAESVAHMTRNVLPNGADIHELARSPGFLEVDGGGFGFGLSMYVLTDPHVAQGGILSGRGEFGWGGFASTSFFVDPVYKMSCILMTQLTPSNAYPIRAHLRYMSHWALQDRAPVVEEGAEHGTSI